MRPCRTALCLAVALPVLAVAADVPVAGHKLALRASSSTARKRNAAITIKDPAVAAPLPDPTLGASLVVNGGAADGQCRAEIALDPSRWRPIGGNGATRGYRYAAPAPGTQGVRSIVLRPGRLIVKARGTGWPCDLSAATEREPVSVVLRVAGTRYCAAFGPGQRNTARRFVAGTSTAPAACPETDATGAFLNILHGIFCPVPTAACRLSERVDLLFQWVAAAGCPDVVTLTEVSTRAVPLIESHLASACPFPYQSVLVSQFGVDDHMLLTRYPATSTDSHLLYKDFRHVLFVRIDHPLGPLDVFTTHLASGSDGANNPCAGDCPPECVAAGATTVRQCQGVQLADYVALRHDVATPALVSGDFNQDPTSFVYAHVVARGWTDTYLAAGNPECNPGTGIGCTSGRADEDLSDMESPASNESERIDYFFLVPPGPGSLCTPIIDSGADADGDGTATRIFADDPNPFAPTCGPAPDPICWPSDHEGAQVDLDCG
jgi:endonuclease/exonuclease/phosphatase family metal-dependent hydrolase